MSLGRTLGSLSGQRMETRISLLQQPPGLHNPGFRFVLAAKAGDRSELTTYRVITTSKELPRRGVIWNVAVAILVSTSCR
jgi:hypothetical protein